MFFGADRTLQLYRLSKRQRSLSAKAYDERYVVIRNAQAALCGNSDNFILAGSFEGYINDMIDQYHYNQHAYNEVGKSVGKSMAEWVSEK